MRKILLFILVASFSFSCSTTKKIESHVVTSDIDLFWSAYDQIVLESDSARQVELLESLYLQKCSPGGQRLIEVKNYSADQYIELINTYPKFWSSIRGNTYRSKGMEQELGAGIEKLRVLYPELHPAKIYFTVGAMRSNGTTRDGLVLIGSELAMADSKIDISEFEGETKTWLETYFGSNPIDDLVLLNVHEYVHTQQQETPSNLMHQVLYEGVAEFVSVKAMGVPSAAPAIEFGKKNPAVKQKFEKEMFYERTYDWLWSNSDNEFDVRDLGYYIGYALAEQHYQQASDSTLAIKQLIEIDFNKPSEVDAFIDRTHFFSKPIATLRAEDRSKRPNVISIQQFENGSQDVNPKITHIGLEFSEPLNGYNTGLEYGELGEAGFPKLIETNWSEEGLSWTLQVELKPDTHYQILISANFRTEAGIPLNPYLIDFKTRSE